MTRICSTCGNPFTTRHQFNYCSIPCYREGRRNRPFNVYAMARRLGIPPSTLRGWIRAGRFVWNADGKSGTVLSAQPPPARPATPRACVVCGKTFLASTPRRICSRSCESHAYRERRAERLAVGQPACRVCGCRGVTVPLISVPQDAGGGVLCALCLVEGLRRAA